MAPASPIFALWRARQRHGTLYRAGGWAEQPAGVIVQLDFLDLLESTWRCYRQPEFDWSKFSQLQMDLIKWLEHAEDEPKG